MPGNCSVENSSSSAPAPAEPRTEREQSSELALAISHCVSGAHSDTSRSSRTLQPRESWMVLCTSAHGSPHSPTLLQLYSSHSNWWDLGQAQAQVEGHWPDLFQVTPSPALCSAGDKITRGSCSLPLVLYYRCFWPTPVTCLTSLS